MTSSTAAREVAHSLRQSYQNLFGYAQPQMPAFQRSLFLTQAHNRHYQVTLTLTDQSQVSGVISHLNSNQLLLQLTANVVRPLTITDIVYVARQAFA